MSWWPGRVDVGVQRPTGAEQLHDHVQLAHNVARHAGALWGRARAAAQAAVAEPPPVSALAIRVIPAATDLEDVVDAITAVAASAEVGVVDATRVGARRDQLSRLARVGSE